MSDTKHHNPLISVILTSYNYAQYVSESLESVFKQNYDNVELIVVDDGSEDSSRDVINEVVRYAPMPVKTIFKENGGQSSAFNAAFEDVKGEFVAFIDSDDVWKPEKLHVMAGLMEACPDGGVYQHQVEVGFGGPRRLEYIISGDVFAGWKQIGPRINLAVYQGRISPFVPTVGLMFRKAVLDKVFPIPQRLVTCPDAYLTRGSAACGPLYSHPGILATWRDHESNAGKSKATGYHEYWLKTIMPILNEFYCERGIPIELYYERIESDAVPPRAAPSPPPASNPGLLQRLFGNK